MDLLREHEVINTCDPVNDEENERVLDRLSRDDPTLKKLTLVMPWYDGSWSNLRIESMLRLIRRLFEEIKDNSSLKVLDLNLPSLHYLYFPEVFRRVTRAFSRNMSLNEIRINTTFGQMRGFFFDIFRASPNLKALTIRTHSRTDSLTNLDDITAVVQVLLHLNLHSLTIEGPFAVLPAEGAAFAVAFQANQTIKTLMMRRGSVHETSAVSFVEALRHDHSLETIIFDGNILGDDHVVSIVRTLCRKHLKTLSILSYRCISQEGYTRIIQTLTENDHGFIKLDLFQDSEDSPWQNNIRLEIEKLTWNNRLQVEKEMWIDQFLEFYAPTKELLFRALERAKKVDNEQFSKAPNLLFHLIKESPDFIVQAML